MSRQPHGNKGNSHASKPAAQKTGANITCRVLKANKAAWVKMGERSADTKGLTEWIVKTLNAAVDRDLKE
ncbi:MAG: hypothetical protein RPR40_03885 [Bermanella sp.]